MKAGFTLIELSIVLVIIALIIGGILTGQDLINAAAQRAQIAQIEHYNTAVRAFQGKYGYLPGDIPSPYATNFGFVARGANIGEGDGDGVLTAYEPGGWICGCYEGGGEDTVFWEDLSAAGLIDGGFTTATETGFVSTNPAVLYPNAKIGQGDYVYAWSGGPSGTPTDTGTINGNGINYYGVSAISSIIEGNSGLVDTPGLSVLQAYNIDKKVDDGLPQSGNVIAVYVNYNVGWGSATEGWAGGNEQTGTYTTATAGSATSCFDNSATANGIPGVAGKAQHYSLEMNNATGQNCSLSFKFQ